MKKFLKSIAIVACCAFATSCAVISTPVTATEMPLGTKCGVSESMTYLGIYTDNTESGINEAAKKAGIKKISHVDSYTTMYLLGIIQKQTIKVYGE